MTVTCPKCRASLTVPEDRLPKAKVVNAACPRCGGAVAIDPTQKAGSATPVPAGVPGRSASEHVAYGEHGQPKALVCAPEPTERQHILGSLKESGYAAHAAAGPAEAVERLRFAAYAVVVVHEGFDQAVGGGPSLWDALTEMPMGTRRATHTVFVGSGVASHDAAAAFARSVDLTINSHDLPHFSDALKRSLAETERLYRVFRETQVALGRG